MDSLSLLNSVLSSLESYGLRPMGSPRDTFLIRPGFYSLTLCCREDSVLCSVSVVLDGDDSLRPLLLNCSGELSRGNRLFMPSGAGGGVMLGRVVSLTDRDEDGLRKELVDFLDSVEKDRLLFQENARVSSGSDSPSTDISRELLFNLDHLV